MVSNPTTRSMTEEEEFSDCGSLVSDSDCPLLSAASEDDDDIGNVRDFVGEAVDADEDLLVALSSLGSSYTANVAIRQQIEELQTVGRCSFRVALQCSMDGFHHNAMGSVLR